MKRSWKQTTVGVAVAVSIGVVTIIWSNSTTTNVTGNTGTAKTVVTNVGDNNQTTVVEPFDLSDVMYGGYDLDKFQEEAAKRNPDLVPVFALQNYQKTVSELEQGLSREEYSYSRYCVTNHQIRKGSAQECNEYIVNMQNYDSERLAQFEENRHFMSDIMSRQTCLYLRDAWTPIGRWGIQRKATIKC